MMKPNERKAKPSNIFIFLLIIFLVFIGFQNWDSEKSANVAFSHQVEHLVNLDLIDLDQARKVAINDNLVSFSGTFQSSISDRAKQRYNYLQALDRHNQLYIRQQDLQKDLGFLKNKASESSVAFMQLTGTKIPKTGYIVVDPIYDASYIDGSIILSNIPEKGILNLHQLQERWDNGSLDLAVFQKDLSKLLNAFQSQSLGIGNESIKKKLKDLEADLKVGYNAATCQKVLKELSTITTEMQEENHGIKLSSLRNVQLYKDAIEKYDFIVSEIEKNDAKLNKLRENVADVIWYFDNKELSTRALESQDIESFSRWFSQASKEWTAFEQNSSLTFKAPGQPRTLPLEKNFKSEDTPTHYFEYILPVLMSGGLVLLILYFMIAKQKGGVNGAMNFGKSPAKLLDKTKNKVTFADVAGCDEAKEELVEIVDFLKDPSKFTNLGAHIPKGVLCVGAPGTGKTLIARAVAGEADRPFFSISGSDFVEMFVGVGASRIRDMFEQAKRNAPCIIFIDEIDAVGRHRGSGIGGGHDEREQTLNQLLVEMDGFDTNEGIILIAATNRPDVLDKALLRPGRFDRRIVVDLPDLKGRFDILKVHAKRIKIDSTVDLMHVARNTPGASGADLANILNEAALLAARRGRKLVTDKEVLEATDKVRYGKERRSLDRDQEDKRTTAYHEAGHAIVGLKVKHSDPVDKVTIIPRGMSLGSTHFMPKKNRLNYWKSELIDHIAICMGGRIAEEIFLNDVSSGASSDIANATALAHSMVCEWGMSDLGTVTFKETSDAGQYLGIGSYHEKNYSEETSTKIDAEVKKITDEGYARAKQIIEENKDKLDLIASMLIEFETLDQLDMEEISNGNWDIEKKKARLKAENEKFIKQPPPVPVDLIINPPTSPQQV